jgi:tape measure domain-containing protein
MVSTAARVGSINVLFQVQYGQAVAGTQRLASEVERGGTRMQRSVRDTDRSVLSLNSTMSRLNGRQFNVLALSALRANSSVERLRGTLLASSALLGGFGAAFTIRGLQEYSDTYKTVGNRLRVVKGEAQDLRDVEKQTFDVAQRARAQYEATGILFARMAGASKRLGISQKDVLRTTETIQKAFLVGGSTPTEAAQSSIQLSQGIASNRLQGDELRSVLENPALGQLLADRITGGDIGKLRDLAAEGELTAGVVIKAFRDASGEIDKMFAETEQTVGQAFILIDNALMRYIGTSKNANATSGATVALLNAIAENFEGIADTVFTLGAAMATVFAGRGINALQTHAAGLKQIRVDALAAAAAEVQTANAGKLAAAQHLASTRAAYEMAKANTVSTTTRRRLGRELQSALAAELNATKTAQASTLAHASALRSASVSGMAMAAAGRAASSAWAFVGGPWGAALLALGAIMFVASKRAEEAQERSDRYAEAIEKAGNLSERASGGIRVAAEAYFEVENAATAAQRAVSRDQAATDTIKNLSGLEEILNAAGRGLLNFRTASSVGYAELKKLVPEFVRGELSAEEFAKAADALAELHPDLSPLIAELQKAAEQADASRGRFDALSKSIEGVGEAAGKGDRLQGFGRFTEDDRSAAISEFRRMNPDAFGTKDSIADSITKGFNAAVDGFVDRVVGAESGGDRFAKNPRSSATGVGQFIDSTWIDQFRKEFPREAAAMSRDAILGLRTNADVSKKLIESYARENAAVLQAAGIAVQGAADEYKLQLAHFLGPQGAANVLKAAPGTAVSSVLGADQIRANPEILGGGATVDDVIAYGQKRAGMSTGFTEDYDLRVKQKEIIEATIASLQRSTEATEAETRALGMSQYDRLRYLYALEETQKLEEQGIVLDDKAKKAIQEKADALARATVANDAHTEAQRRNNEQIEEAAGLLKDFMSGIRSALQDGKITTEEWGDIFLSVLDKIISKIEDQLINALFGLGSAAGGGGGGGGGLLGGLFGGGGGGLLGGFLIPGILHAGGDADRPNSYRPIPISSITRAHSGDGLRHNELLRVLEDTETVLTGQNTSRAIDALGGAASSIKTTKGEANTYNIDARGADAAAVTRLQRGLVERDRQFSKNVAAVQRGPQVRKVRP